jgi:inhibitor of KinA
MRSFRFWKGVFCAVDTPYRIYTLGDGAITVDWGQIPGPQLQQLLISLHDHLKIHPFPGFIESVPAYSSLTIFFDPLDRTLFSKVNDGETSAWVSAHVSACIVNLASQSSPNNLVCIPVCYDPEFGPDLSFVSSQCGLELDDLITLHTSVEYRVYMIGFVPGFPYLGMTDPRLDVPRKKTPLMKVPEGSVALAGRQTGIYPLSTPGGWQIIGRTPLRLFDPSKPDPFLLRPGMTVRFDRIDRDDFEKLSQT